ncbi:MAG: hypothetical protein ACRD16_11480 [Thermoanaerobaculia bacterium]
MKPILSILLTAAVAAPALGAAPIRNETLPFLADNYPKALAEARSRKLPIFAEAWAPW